MCGGKAFAEAFAKVFLRKGSIIKTTDQGVKETWHDAWFHYNDWGFKKNGVTTWYSNFEEFLQASEWIEVGGKR